MTTPRERPDREGAPTPAHPPVAPGPGPGGAPGPGSGVAAGSAPAVEVEDLSVVLGSRLILSDVDLRIEPGESVALLGANGSGKSTLVRAVLGLLPIRTGSARIFGHDVTRRSAVPWRRVGYVPQRVGAAAGVPATALEVVRSGLLDPRRPLADRGRRARERALKALEAVGLAERADDHVQVFSGGQSQRVLIARALVRSPELLILDEPLAGIDRDSRRALARILESLRSQGITLLTILHEMGELADVVERAVVLSEGRLSWDGPAADLAPARHDHARHDEIGHDAAGDCEHSHPHGDTAPAVHHAPALASGGAPLPRRTAP